MTQYDDEPVVPWQIPAGVIALLVIVIVLITLAAVGLVGVLALGANVPGLRGFEMNWPDGDIGRIVWMQTVLTIATMFLVWLFSILVVAAYAGGSHRNAAVNAVAMVRVSIAIIVVRFVANAAIPVVATGSWSAVLSMVLAGAPLMLAQIALLIAADAYFCAVRENAPS